MLISKMPAGIKQLAEKRRAEDGRWPEEDTLQRAFEWAKCPDEEPNAWACAEHSDDLKPIKKVMENRGEDWEFGEDTVTKQLEEIITRCT